MALFGGKDKEIEVELFTSEPNERVFEFKKSKTIVRIDDYFIRIARKSNMSIKVTKIIDIQKVLP
ncbi:TPA: hypothetical protein VBE35_000070 [Streptococcus agalactiae]|nr:hypothetical protein [Streptococcus agalactiae]